MMKKRQRQPQLNKIRDYEKNIILPKLIEFFKRKTSTHNRVTGQEIVDYFMKRKEQGRIDFPTFDTTRLHKLVNYIRVNELLPVCASKNGYWLSYDLDELEDQADSLQGRIDGIQAAIRGIRNMKQDIENEKKEGWNTDLSKYNKISQEIPKDDIFHLLEQSDFLDNEPTYKKIERKMKAAGFNTRNENKKENDIESIFDPKQK